MIDVKIDKSVDAREAACPGPLMELIKAMRSEPVGSVVEILSAEKGTIIDVPAWLKKVGQELIGIEERGDHWSIVAKKIK